MTDMAQTVCPCKHDLGEDIAVQCRTLDSLMKAQDYGDYVCVTTLDGRHSLHLEQFSIDGTACNYAVTGTTVSGRHVVTIRYEWAYGYDLCLRGTAVVDRWPSPCG